MNPLVRHLRPFTTEWLFDRPGDVGPDTGPAGEQTMRNRLMTDVARSRGSVRRPAPAMRPVVEGLEGRRLLAASVEVTSLLNNSVVPDGDDTPSQADGTDLGQTPVAGTSPFRSFRVTNTSAADDLELGTLVVPAGFQVEKMLPPLLGPGSSDVFTISRAQDAQELREGVVQFTTNAPNAEVYDFAVRGEVVPAVADSDNVFEDVPSFTDEGAVGFRSGTDGDGVPVEEAGTELVRFNVPAGEAQVGFTLSAAFAAGGSPNGAFGATADVELLVARDEDEDGQLDLDELQAPLTTLLAPPDGSRQERTVTLGAGTYFGVLRTANFAVTDGAVEQPFVNIDYTLAAELEAVAAPGVAVTFAGTSVPDGDGSPSRDEGTDFGTVQVGQARPERRFTITNSGSADLELGAVTVTGPFQVVSAPAATVAPGASTDLVIAMATSSLGDLAGGVSFSTNVETRNPFNFELAGTVTETPPPTAPEITVSLDNGGGALADGQAAVVQFGNSVQGQPGATRRFIVRNDGNGPLQLGAVAVPAGFTISEPLAATLAPGESDGFTVTLDTGALGERTGAVVIPNGDADEDPFDFNVRGVVALPGATPEADIAVVVDDVALSSGQTVDFGAAAVGTPGPQRVVTLRNDGSASLSLGTVSVPTGYTLVAGPALTTLAPGGSTTITIALDSGTVGTFTGQAAVVSNDPDENPFALNLTGVVAAEAQPSPLDVSDVTGKVPAVVIAGDRRARGSVAFRVTNTTGAPFAGPVTFTALASSDAAPGASDVQLVSVTRNVKLKAGASRAMRLKFAFPPTVPQGDRNVLVTAAADRTSDTAAGPRVSVQAPFVRLTGLPAGAPAARPLAFGRRAAFAVPLQNVGNVPTSRTPATYTLAVSRDGTDAGQVYQTTATGRLNLRPGASRPQRVSVTFPPGSFPAGTYTLIVRLNAELNQTNGDTVALIPFTIA